MEHRFDCSVVGDAMIDVLLPLSTIRDFRSLSHGGVANTKMQLSPGGSANVAFYVNSLGGSSVFQGKVGADYFGSVFLKDLKTNGIVANVPTAEGENTGLVFVIIFPNGERFFIDDRGSNASLAFGDINVDLIKDSKYFFFSGYSFQDEGFRNIIERLLREIANDTLVVFNPGAPNLTKQYRNSFIDIIGEYVSILITNEAEAEYLTGNRSERSITDSLFSLADTVVLTKGGRGSIIASGDEIYDIEASSAVLLDTTGAGDAYAGGFICGLCRGWDIKSAGEYASRVAGKVVSHIGARVDCSSLAIQ